MKTKIIGEYVVGYDPVARDHLIYRQGEVVYEEDTILFVGHHYAEPVDQVIDAGLALISPGFIDLDALADIDHAILDTWVDPERDLGLLWSADYFQHRRHDLFTREEEAFKHRYALSQLALNGITTFMPIAGEYYKRWCETYEEWADVVDILGEIGLRGYLGPSYRSGINVVHADGRRDVLWDEAEGLAGLRDAVRLVEEFDGTHNGRVKGCLLPARIETVTLDLLRRTKAAAASLGCLTRLHCLQGAMELRFMRQWYGKTTMQVLEELALLGPHFLIPHALLIGGHSHAEYPYSGELEILAESGTPVIHCPLAYAHGARALESFRRYRAAGVTLAMGTDTFPPDMIRVMEHGLTAGNLVEGEKSAHQAADFFRAATLGGAEALGRDDLGRLAPGAKADIVVIDLTDYRLGPIDDPIRTLVMMGTGHAVRTVIVDGRPVVQDGQIPGMDVDAMRAQAQAYHAKMRAAYSERDYRRRPEAELFPPSFRTIQPPSTPHSTPEASGSRHD
jgi:cytosine/adenosine deaminase-related metal-dependent hydrolase